MRLKTAFLRQLPYLLVWADDPIVAKQCLADYERDCAALPAQHIHRVSHRFLALGSPFRPMLCQVAEGGVAPEALLRELTAYKLIPLSESDVEGIHAQVQRGSGMRAAKAPWRFATVRLNQNIALYQEAADDRDLSSAFAASWASWKTITKKATANCTARWLQTPLRIELKTFFKAVYRLGDYALEDWSDLKRSLPALAPPVARPPVAYSERLQREYARSVLKRRGVYTLPLLLPSRAHDHAIVPAGAPLQSSGFLCFQVLDPAPAAKKTIRTTTSILDDSSLRSAMQLQFFSQWPQATAEPGNVVVAFASEVKVLDPLALSPWASFRSGLREWTPQVSDIAGCLDLVDGRPAVPTAGVAHPECPALVLLEHLHAHGWQPGRLRQPHLPADSGLQAILYHSPDAAKGKAYLRCLIMLPALFGQGPTGGGNCAKQKRSEHSPAIEHPLGVCGG